MPAITIAQIIIAFITICLILLQNPSTGGGLGGIFGGGGLGEVYQQRRGFEKLIYIITIIFVILFIAISVLNLVI
ncbi:MAG: preprotein translocase subunit SecG [Candidatus Liptonbacteria bacterium]|nr:preprotein translocase subunit SecG [Candidatus Liptonbacteria bacterium]